ncbi:hypothetical protein ACXR0O_29585 [Verrucomicrobiota bacterium sgz303538]
MKNVALLALLFFGSASVSSFGSELIRSPLFGTAEKTPVGFYVDVAEQFTKSATLQNRGRDVGSLADECLKESVTQVSLGYNFSNTFGVHLEAPFISRDFQRLRVTGIEEGTTKGFGDISLFVGWNPVQFIRETGGITVRMYGGLELPTGDSDRLGDRGDTVLVLDKLEPPRFIPETVYFLRLRVINGVPVLVKVPRIISRMLPPRVSYKEVEIPLRIRGRDLALGSGSVDGIVGGTVQARWKQLFFTADVRYTIHSEGEFDYQYGDQFQWIGGPGVYAWYKGDTNLALQLICSGESNREDKIRGKRQQDTAMTTVFLGPGISASWRNRLSAQVTLGWPVLTDNSGLQLVPDYRVQASLAWQF